MEFYVYYNKEDILKGIAALKSAMEHIEIPRKDTAVIEKNLLLFPGYDIGFFYETQLERLLADLRD